MNWGPIEIMWKEIGIGILILFLLRSLLDIYMIKSYEKLIGTYGIIEKENVKIKAKKLLKLYNVFSVGPWNKQMYLAYNGTCWLLASMCLIESDESGFIDYLNKVKKQDRFEMKPFALSLYYRSRENIAQMIYYYNVYMESQHVDENMDIIMNCLFGNKERMSLLEKAVNSFHNPALIQLFKENDLL